MVKTTRSNSPPSGVASDTLELWYVPDRRIRTKSAFTKAVDVVEWIQTGNGLDAKPDETVLFAALHTCAYRASRRARRIPISRKERSVWSDRWQIIRSYLVQKNLGLAHSMVSRFAGPTFDEDDMLSDALYALTRSVDRFNPWMGFRFSTYACNVIARSLIRRGKRESKYRNRFAVQYDVMLDQAEPSPDSQAELYAERLNRGLDKNLGHLNELESHVLAQRFPRNGNNRASLKDIGQGVGLSKERIRQIQQIALGKLRELLDQDPVLG